MAMHRLELSSDGTVKNLFTDSVPAITPGSQVYIQNITNNQALFSDTSSVADALVITEIGTATSVLSVAAGETAYLAAEGDRVVLICQVV